MVPIDSAGRIVLPKGLRQELAIKPGDRFKVSIQGSSVTLTPHKERVSGFVRKGKALVFTCAEDKTLADSEVSSILTDSRLERSELRFRASSDKKRRS
jgi:AbrB family looped-hinge helix DNA binding protein